MNIIFMGTPHFAVPSLKALLDSKHDVICVVCQPDKPSGRGKKITSPPVKELAERYSVRVEQPSKIRDDSFDTLINELSPDMICVVAYGKIIPKNILDKPRYGCINVHASLLPKYRGAAPVNWAVIRGEKETGITTMLMDEGMDTGDILLRESTKIGEDETSLELGDRLSQMGADLLIETIERIETGNIKPRKQDHESATYAPILKKADGEIDWNMDAEGIRNLIRGCQPWPGAYTRLDNKILKIFRAQTSNANGSPGEVLETGDAVLRVATGRGSLDIEELQLEGGKRMKTSEFLKGHSVDPGTVLG